MLRFALHLRYTSAQAYRVLLEKFPLPSFSLLNKLQKGGVDAMKAIKMLKDKGHMSKKVILIIDEMFLQKCAEYQAGVYSGTDSSGQLYKGIVSFMITGLKKNIPYVVQSLPEVTFTGKWLAKKISECIKTLHESGFSVRGVVTIIPPTSMRSRPCGRTISPTRPTTFIRQIQIKRYTYFSITFT